MVALVGVLQSAVVCTFMCSNWGLTVKFHFPQMKSSYKNVARVCKPAGRPLSEIAETNSLLSHLSRLQQRRGPVSKPEVLPAAAPSNELWPAAFSVSFLGQRGLISARELERRGTGCCLWPRHLSVRHHFSYKHPKAFFSQSLSAVSLKDSNNLLVRHWFIRYVLIQAVGFNLLFYIQSVNRRRRLTRPGDRQQSPGRAVGQPGRPIWFRGWWHLLHQWLQLY